jgi:hypothetical protein
MIEVDISGLEERSCKSKVRHETKAKAVKAANRFNSNNQCKKKDQRKPYRCRFCEGWHIGRPSKITAVLSALFARKGKT